MLLGDSPLNFSNYSNGSVTFILTIDREAQTVVLKTFYNLVVEG